ncbi:MAG: hypothetical protein RL885_17090 [Planctomycetota bacterium]
MLDWSKTGLLLLAAMLISGPAFGQHKAEQPKSCVEFAPTWEAAVDEAKLLNVPIVVHSHGFYCGPCWGMHRSVLQNKKYIEFASRYSVEVIALGRLEEGVAKGDPKAATYAAKNDDGEEVEYMLEFPGLTYDQMIALRKSPASRYNDTGKIPFTCLVDPHTGEEIQRWSGGQSAGTLMEAVMLARRDLIQKHGEGLDRRDLQAVVGAVKSAKSEALDGDFTQAFRILEKAVDQDAHAHLRSRVDAANEAVMAIAKKTIGDLEALAAEDASKAKRELSRLKRQLRGTPLEEAVQSAIDSI